MQLKILLLEDNPADADFLQETLVDLAHTRWTIIHVERLSAALEAVAEHRFDVVLSDLSLPDATGLDTVVQIHAVAPDLPIVVLTGLNDEDIGLAAVRQGAQDYLIKGEIQQNLLTRILRYAIERAQTQKIMRQQAAAMSACREGIAILNPSHELVYVNQAFATLHDYAHPNDLIGKTYAILYDEATYENLNQQINAAMQQRGYWQGEAIARRQSNETFYQELSINSLDDGGFICNVRDITERKQAEAEILRALAQERELNELKSRFVSIVSHEFRTPLTTILSATEILQKHGWQSSDDRNRLRLGRVVQGVQRMSQLLDDVLMFSRAEVGKIPFHPVLLNPVEFCQDLIEEIQLQFNTEHQIILSEPLHHCPCDLDEQLFRYILTNLISNAIKYSTPGSQIQIELGCDAEQLTVRVADQGIGIPKADLEHLFAVFHRGSNVGTTPGTGLGLAIVKQCIELHGGTIRASSEIGRGTEFIVELPIHQEHSGHAQNPAH